MSTVTPSVADQLQALRDELDALKQQPPQPAAQNQPSSSALAPLDASISNRLRLDLAHPGKFGPNEDFDLFLNKVLSILRLHGLRHVIQ